MADAKVIDKHDEDSSCSPSFLTNKKKWLWVVLATVLLAWAIWMFWSLFEKVDHAQVTADSAVADASVAKITADGAVKSTKENKVKIAEVEQNAQNADAILGERIAKNKKAIKANVGWLSKRLTQVEGFQGGINDQLRKSQRQADNQAQEIAVLKNKPKGRIKIKLPNGSRIKASDGWVSEVRADGWVTVKEK